MDVSQFLLTLLHNLSTIEFVEKVDIHTEAFILKGRIILKKNYFVQIYFNESTQTTTFALIKEDKRIWGIDYDNLRRWHLHPIANPESHQNIEPQTIEKIVDGLKEVWRRLI